MRTSSTFQWSLSALAVVFLAATACSDAPAPGNGGLVDGGELDGAGAGTTADGGKGGDDGVGIDGVGGEGDSGEGDSGDTGAGDGDAGDSDAGNADTAAGDGGDAATSDSGNGDANGASDVVVGPVDDFGKACKADADCKSGFCVEGYAGFVCTQTCDGAAACPSGHVCSKVALGGGQVAFLCLAQVSKVCHPCKGDLDCSGGTCVEKDGESFCAPACGAGIGDCPTSHTCEALSDGAGAATVCMPTSGSCKCSAKTVGVVRACQQSAGPLTCYGVEICAAAGWSACGLPDEVCDGKDNDCDGVVDDGFVDNNGGYTTVKACGACGNDCTFTSYANATVSCDASAPPAQCAMVCKASTYDVDDNPKNGCECVYDSATDLPDGKDHNCDGVDGEVGNAIFVAKVGKDSAIGTLEAPVASIGKGIALAKAQGKRDVYVATGVYDESVALVAGVSVYGGYSANFAFHDTEAYGTVIVAAAPSAALPGALNGLAITSAAASGKLTIVDGLTVYAASVKAKGASTYGLYLRDCDVGLQVRNGTFIAGDAGAGESGDGGGNGSPGNGGTAGTDAKDLTGKSACDPSKDQSSGGGGGSKTCGGDSVSGGKGGTAICPAYNVPAKPPLTAENGSNGNGSGAGSGGVAGLDNTIGATGSCTVCTPPKDAGGNFLSSSGSNGVDGGNGSLGGAGVGCKAGTAAVASGLWVVAAGIAGGGGGPGAGGGGGGAGGGVDVTASCTSKNSAAGFRYPDVGGSGGGGGSGGCGGLGGKSGTSGGGSFAAFVVTTKTGLTLPKLSANQLVSGNGGDGGQGGQGGVGGLGGDGKFGGGDDPKKLAWCAGTGGRGGQGGVGGHGGGGGGGCGGASWGLYIFDAAKLAGEATHKAALAAMKASNTVELYGKSGKGGQGGKSLGKDGGDGDNGAGGLTNW